MSSCPELTLTIPSAPSLAFCAGFSRDLSLALTAYAPISGSSFISITQSGVVMASSYPIYIAEGFSRVAAAINSPVYLQTEGILGGLSGLSTGTVYFLSNTPGQISATAPTSGISQQLGVAVDSTTLLVNIQQPIFLN